MHDFDFERYKSLDVSKARPARLNPKIKQLQDNLGVTSTQDVLNTIKYYEELDTTDFPVVEPAVIKKLRQRKEIIKQFTHFLDSEALEILSKHNTKQDYKR